MAIVSGCFREEWMPRPFFRQTRQKWPCAGPNWVRKCFIRDLNPEIRGYVIPAGARTVDIPAVSAEGFHDRLQTMATEVSGQNPSVYTVQKGDNLTLISKRLGIPIRALLLLNRMDSRTVLHPGNQLFVSPMSFTE